MRKMLPVLPFLFIVSVLTQAQPRLSGTWQNEVLSGGLFQLSTVELSQDGRSLTGTVTMGGVGTVAVYDGKIEGNSIVFKFDSPDGDRTITLTGEVNGDEIAFTRSVEVREGGNPGGPGIGGARGARQFTLSRVPDGQAPAQPRGLPFPRQLTLFNRQGDVLRLVGEPALWNQPVLSPDGTRLAVIKGDRLVAQTSDLWVFDLSRGTSTQLTTSPAPAAPVWAPVWSPDGSQIAFFSFRENYGGLYRMPVDGSGTEELLYRHTLGGGMTLTDWSADGRFLAFGSGDVLYAVRLDGEVPSEPGDAIEFPRSEFEQQAGRFSPNSRFLAYRSNESGEFEVYVREFNPSDPGTLPAGKWQISNDGGLGLAHWRRDGQELYYLGGAGDVMAVDVTSTGTFTTGEPRRLFRVPDTIPLVFAVPQPPERREVTVAPEILARYAGTYEHAFVPSFKLTLEGNQLWAQTTEAAKLPIFAESETSFYYKSLSVDIEFVMDDQGNVTHMMAYVFGTGFRMPRK